MIKDVASEKLFPSVLRHRAGEEVYYAGYSEPSNKKEDYFKLIFKTLKLKEKK